MRYFILPLFLIVFFNLLGNVIKNKYELVNFNYNGFLGLAVFYGLFEIISLFLAYFQSTFTILFIISTLFFVVSFIFIFINKKYICFKFKTIEIIVIFGLLIYQLLMTSRHTIGSLYRYDTLNYANFITGVIYAGPINTINSTNGGIGTSFGFAAQGYLHLASYLYYLINGLCNKLHVSFFYFTQHTWMYSTLLYYLHAEMIVNLVSFFKIKKKLSYIFIWLFVCVFMFNFYWNNEQAFLGNSYRMMLCSYMFIYIYEYFKTNEDNKYLWIFLLLNYANLSFAACNSTLTIIYVFGIWLFSNNKNNSTKILLLTLIVPIGGLLFTLSQARETIVIKGMLSVLVLVLLSNQIDNITDKIKLKKVAPYLALIFMVISSLFITKNPLDLSDFLNNMSGISDMSWDYTDNSETWRLFANIIYYISLITMFVKRKDNKIINCLCAIAIIFFNPWSSPIQNKYFITFYRNYDMVINFGTLFYAISIIENLDYSKVIIMSLIGLSVISSYGQLHYIPEMYFEKEEDYNPLLRMTNDEADAIEYVKNLLDFNGDIYLTSISSIYQLRTELPNIMTLYGRSKTFIGGMYDFELYKIFFPKDYDYDPYAPKNPQYDRLNEFLDTYDFKLIVQDKKLAAIDEENGIYMPLYYLISDYGTYPIYENDTFAIYYYPNK